jgi:hypothetical protein
METRPLTVLFADPKEPARDLFRATVETHGGRHVKTIGSAELCVFEEPPSACRAAMEFRRQAGAANFRIGISHGDVTLSPQNAFGEAVNQAAQLQGMAEAGQVYVSEAVFRRVEPEIACRDAGLRSFRSGGPPVRVFAVEGERSKAPPEVFDFSRVQQERLQEEEELRPAAGRPRMSDAVLALADEDTAPRPGSRAPRTPHPPHGETTNPATELRKRKKVKALLMFLIFAVAVPGLLLTAYLSLQRMTAGLENARKVELDLQLSQSEVLRSLQTPSRRSVSEAPAVPAEIPIGTLLVRTKPPGARVFVNNRPLEETTPIRIRNVRAKIPLNLRLEKGGYRRVYQIVNVAENEEKEIEVRLEKARP